MDFKLFFMGNENLKFDENNKIGILKMGNICGGEKWVHEHRLVGWGCGKTWQKQFWGLLEEKKRVREQ